MLSLKAALLYRYTGIKQANLVFVNLHPQLNLSSTQFYISTSR
jgi:hypothetical protein